MIFKKLSLERIQFTTENTKLLKKMVKKQCQAQIYPMKDIMDRYAQTGVLKSKGKRGKE